MRRCLAGEGWWESSDESESRKRFCNVRECSLEGCRQKGIRAYPRITLLSTGYDSLCLDCLYFSRRRRRGVYDSPVDGTGRGLVHQHQVKV